MLRLIGDSGSHSLPQPDSGFLLSHLGPFLSSFLCSDPIWKQRHLS